MLNSSTFFYILSSIAVYCCNFDDKKIISGGSDGLIKIWDAYTGDNTVSFAGHKGEVVRTRVNRATPAEQPFGAYFSDFES